MQDLKWVMSRVCCFREEWQWLQTLSCLQKPGEMSQGAETATHRLQDELRTAIKELMAHINTPGSQVRAHLSLCCTSTLNSGCCGTNCPLQQISAQKVTIVLGGLNTLPPLQLVLYKHFCSTVAIYKTLNSL